MNHPTQPLSQPLLVLISGAPGSGKTTLAKLLAERTGLYHVERDNLKLGIEFTSRSDPKDRNKTVVPIYLELLFQLLKLRVSIIADASHYQGKSEADLQRYGNIATVVNIHCRAANHHERAQKRDTIRVSAQPEWLSEYTPKYTAAAPQTINPIAHGYTVLEVDTSEGYKPTIDVITDWLYQQLSN